MFMLFFESKTIDSPENPIMFCYPGDSIKKFDLTNFHLYIENFENEFGQDYISVKKSSITKIIDEMAQKEPSGFIKLDYIKTNKKKDFFSPKITQT